MGCDKAFFAYITGKYSGQAQILTVQPVIDVQAWSINHNGTLPYFCHFTLNKTSEIYLIFLSTHALLWYILIFNIFF